MSTATATATAPAPRPTVHDFASGTPYSARKVAALFGYTEQWVRNMIRRGKLSAGRLDGRGPWLIGGESVRVLYGSLKLAEDAAAPPPAEESEGAAVRRALAKLKELNAKAGGKAK